MAESNTKISYDFEEDILNLSRGKTSKASIEIGDFIIDIGFDGFVSSIEILNAGENLSIDKNLLKIIKKASMSVIYNPGYIKINLNLFVQEKEKEIVIPLSIDLGHKQVERQEVAFVSSEN